MIECDSADEALELQAKLVLRPPSGNGAVHSKPLTADGEDGAAITGLGRRFLKLVLDNPGITSDDAAQRLGANTSSFPPMHRAIRAWATRSGIDPDRLFMRLVGEQGGRTFQIDQQYRPIVEVAVKE
jgi:hypothetical protein